MKHRFLGVVLCASGLFYGCAAQKPALCTGGPPALDDQEANAYFALLLHNYDRSPQYLRRSVLDCTGTPVLWAPEETTCEESGHLGEPLEVFRLTPNDLVLTSEGTHMKLAWVIVRRFTNGEGIGPVALVEETPDGRMVRALGTLRAYTGHPELKLRKVGDTDVLVAEGEHCVKDRKQSCDRSARLLPLRGTRFMPEPLTDARGACVGPALVHLSRTEVVKAGSGWPRKYELNSSLGCGTSSIGVHEQILVNELDPAQPSAPGRIFRRAEVDRTIQVTKDRMTVDSPSIWSRFLSGAD